MEERTCAAAAVETAPLRLLLPLPFGVRHRKGLAFSKVYAVGFCLLLEGLFLFLLIKNRCTCLRLVPGTFLGPGCPGD